MCKDMFVYSKVSIHIHSVVIQIRSAYIYEEAFEIKFVPTEELFTHFFGGKACQTPRYPYLPQGVLKKHNDVFAMELLRRLTQQKMPKLERLREIFREFLHPVKSL